MSLTFTDEQECALKEIIRWRESSGGGFFSFTGPAGSGKSVLIGELIKRSNFSILTAMTGKAALRLYQCVDGRETSTLHSQLYWPPNPKQPLRFERLRLPPSFSTAMVVDESSMTSPQIYEDLKKWTAPGVKVLFVGDSYQLPPVITEKDDLEKYGEDFSVFKHVQGVELKTVMRSVGGVLRAATKIREAQRILRESDLEEGFGYEYVEHQNPMKYACQDWLQDQDDHYLITWRNNVRMEASRYIRKMLCHNDPLPEPGEPILIKRNGQGHLNGEIVYCGGWEKGPLIGATQKVHGLRTTWLNLQSGGRILVTVQGGGESFEDPRFFDGTNVWVEDWRAFHIDLKQKQLPIPTPVTFGYVLTAHAAQGSEARRVTVFLDEFDLRSSNFNKSTTLPDGSTAPFSSRFIYTSIARGKSRATMVVGV